MVELNTVDQQFSQYGNNLSVNSPHINHFWWFDFSKLKFFEMLLGNAFTNLAEMVLVWLVSGTKNTWLGSGIGHDLV